MDLLAYNKLFVPKGHGFTNVGNSCYFNSLLQCLLSCPSIFETLERNKLQIHIQKNSLARNMLSLMQASLAGESVYDKCIPIWENIVAIAQKRNDHVKINAGSQQDAHEGLMMFLDVLDTIPELKRLFEHRHRIQILCRKCGKWVVDKSETNLVFEIQPNLQTEQLEEFKDIDEFYKQTRSLNDFLMKQNDYVDADFVCPNCKQKGSKFKSTILTMIPEILPVLIKKYNAKMLTPFPAKLEFIASNGKKLIYQLVAQSEHSGSMQGGHYWAVCLRQSNTWNTLDDRSVSAGNPGPTENTYILFYHFTHLE